MRLTGARAVLSEMRSSPNPDDLQTIRAAWDEASRLASRAGWGHVMRGMTVILVDQSDFVARCWDDDRLYFNVSRLAGEAHPARIILHEFGHRVWFHCISLDEQRAWRSGWRSAARAGRLPSSYAKQRDIEDFAEVFAHLITGRIDKTSLRRWEAMRASCKTYKPKSAAPFHASWRRR